MKVLFIIVVLFLLTGSYAIAGNVKVLPFSTTPCLQEGNQYQNFVRIVPDDKAQDSLKTKAWVWYDEKNLHVRMETQIDSSLVKGLYASRDNSTDGDFLRLQIITSPQNFYGYAFYFFPLGSYNDGIRTRSLNMDQKWNSDYVYESTLSDSLWVVDAQIPFKNLRFSSKPPYHWYLVFTQYRKAPDRTYSHPYISTKWGDDYFTAGDAIELTHQLTPEKNYRFRPYYVKKYDLITQETSFDPENVGADFSYNPTSSMRMKATWNPDFSDVPMDTDDDNFNSKYPPYYEENRFFFVEDLDAFGVDSEYFYSRNIMQPQYAVKVTGNTNHLTYGVLEALDKETRVDSIVMNQDDRYLMMALNPRYRRFNCPTVFLNRNNVGTHFDNDIVMLNPDLNFYKKQYLIGTFSQAWLHRIEEDETISKSDDRWTLYWYGQEGDFSHGTTYMEIGPDYYCETGRMYDQDVRGLSGYFNYNHNYEKGYLSGLGGNLSYNLSEGVINKDQFISGFDYSGWISSTKKWSANISGGCSKEKYMGTLYPEWSYFLSYSNWKLDKLFFSASFRRKLSPIYNKHQSYFFNLISSSVSGNLSQQLSYSLSMRKYMYRFEHEPGGQDNDYYYGDGSINWSVNNLTSVDFSSGFDTVEYDTQKLHFNFCVNFKWEFRRECFLFMGMKTAQDLYGDHEFGENWEQTIDLLGNSFYKEYATAYVKCSVTI